MDKLLRVATKAGQVILMCGAETYRVEETIVKICQAYHVEEANAFVLPTGVFVTVVHEGKTHSLNVRINKRSTNLNMIDAVNKLARSIQNDPISLEELDRKLDEIIKAPKYPWYIVDLFAGIGTFGFAFFFGGDFKDALCSFVTGCLVKVIVDYLESFDVSSFIYNGVGGFFITLMAYLSCQFSLGTSADTIIIATIMLLVPGVCITNAVRDSLAGDLVSGIARAVEAILIATSIALGAGVAVSVIRLLGGVM
ncbi:MAG: threonine/serine exporter family protein [Erysipelotrichales bacterium]|nr:threonine/serine exporter family protein [Erysipelotrichales bacterium]